MAGSELSASQRLVQRPLGFRAGVRWLSLSGSRGRSASGDVAAPLGAGAAFGPLGPSSRRLLPYRVAVRVGSREVESGWIRTRTATDEEDAVSWRARQAHTRHEYARTGTPRRHPGGRGGATFSRTSRGWISVEPFALGSPGGWGTSVPKPAFAGR